MLWSRPGICTGLRTIFLRLFIWHEKIRVIYSMIHIPISRITNTISSFLALSFFLFSTPKRISAIVQSLSCVWLFVMPWTAAHQIFLSYTISWSWLKVMFIEWMVPSTVLILCYLLLLIIIIESLNHVWLFMTPWTAAYQAPPSMGFSRQEYWSGVPLPSPKTAE